MYLLTVDIRPTAALTFRVLPGSILDITTYPFVPPTTLSGFLRRLAMVAARIDVPGTAIDDAPYYVLSPSLIALGAYSLPDQRGMIHRTHRKGVKDFTDTSFTRIRAFGKDEQPTFQLHTWEYLITDRLRGYVVAEESSVFESLRQIKGYGCKLGKEGFAYIEEVTEPVELQKVKQNAQPTIVPAVSIIDAAPECPFDLYTLYSFVWQQGKATPQPDSDQRSPVKGYKPFSAACCEEGRKVSLEYLSDGTLFIPCDLVKVLRGEEL